MTSSIDMTAVKPGDRLKFRCGGTATVKQTIERCVTDPEKRVWVVFEEGSAQCAFLKDGKGGYDGSINIYDVVEVIK
jgi:hypothetical protein